MENKINRTMVRECFELQNIIGEDGMPKSREILTIENSGDNSLAVAWRECGDGGYDIHVSVFKLTNHRLTVNGHPFIEWSPFVEINYRKQVRNFCRRFDLERPDEPSILPWTSCDDEEPEENGEYMISWYPGNRNLRGKKAFMRFCEFENGEWLTEGLPQAKMYGGMEVVAWMPLPEQYEEAV